jgi:hypothetical protein
MADLKFLRWMKKFHQQTSCHDILYDDTSSEDEQLLMRPLLRTTKNTNVAGGWNWIVLSDLLVNSRYSLNSRSLSLAIHVSSCVVTVANRTILLDNYICLGSNVTVGRMLFIYCQTQKQERRNHNNIVYCCWKIFILCIVWIWCFFVLNFTEVSTNPACITCSSSLRFKHCHSSHKIHLFVDTAPPSFQAQSTDSASQNRLTSSQTADWIHYDVVVPEATPLSVVISALVAPASSTSRVCLLLVVYLTTLFQ